MIESHSSEGKKLVVLTPNRSMNWETNKKILLAMLAVNLLIGVGFAFIGAWLILPFAGLEILLVGCGMYYVAWKLNFQETIALQAQNLRIQKGVYYPKQVWDWQASSVQLLLQPSNYRLSAPALFLQHLNEKVEIGNFLNREEKIQLREILLEWGVPMHTLPYRQPQARMQQ